MPFSGTRGDAYLRQWLAHSLGVSRGTKQVGAVDDMLRLRQLGRLELRSSVTELQALVLE